MNRYPLLLATLLSLAGCVPGYTSAEFVYAQPAEYAYVVPVDRVVVVTREVLVERGWEVFRVEDDGPNRIIWARRGDGDEIVRVFATPQGQRVVVRGLWEAREHRKHGEGDERDQGDNHDRGRHRGWVNRGQPREIITDIDGRLRRG